MANFQDIFNYLVQGAVIVSIVIAAIALTQSAKSFRKQVHIQIFIEYTRRFEEIMQSFPRNAWGARFNRDSLPDQSDELRLSILRYLNLCSEEFYLYTENYLSKDVWDIWKNEIVQTLRTPLLKREWSTLSEEYMEFPSFLDFVENSMNK